MKVSSCFGVLSSLLIFFVFVPISIVYADGKVVFCKGDLFLSSDGGYTWKKILKCVNREIADGYCLKLGKRSEAALLLSDGSQIRLHSGSVFCLERTGPVPPAVSGKRGVYKLLKGKLWFRNKRKVPKPFFYTPSVVASIRGTEVYLEVLNRELVAVLDGTAVVRVKRNQKEVVSRRGEAVVFADGKLKVEKLVRPELLVQWLIMVPDIRGPIDKRKSAPGVEKALEAMRALFMWDLHKAKELSAQAIELSPNRSSPYVAYSYVLQAEGKFDEALSYARKALTLDSNSIPAVLRVVELLLYQDRLSDAERILGRVKVDDLSIEEKPWFYVLSGYLRVIKRDYKSARKDFERSVSIDPSSAYAWLGLGLVLWSEGDEKQSIECMEKASLSAPFWSWPHLYLGRALYEAGERYEALAELRRASQLDPRDPSPYWNMAVIYRDLFMPAKAVSLLNKALELNDNRLVIRSRFLLDQDRAMRNVNLALALQDLGLYTWAEARGNIAVWNDPGVSSAYYFRAVKSLEVSASDPVTISDLRKAHLLSPPNSNTYTTYQEYTQVLLKSSLRKGLIGALRHNGDYQASVYSYGGGDGWAYSIQGDLVGSEGPEEGSERYMKEGFLRLKKSLGARSELLLENVVLRIKQGDFLPWVYGGKSARDVSLARDMSVTTLGFHHRFHAGSDFLAQLVSFREEVSGFDNWGVRGEAVSTASYGGHRLLLGVAYEGRKEWNLFLHSSRFEMWDTWKVGKDLWIFLMGGYHYSDLPDSSYSTNRVLSGIGVAKFLGNTLFRASFFESAEVSRFSGTLFPSEMAGFSRFSGPDWGGRKKVLALGVDHFWKTAFARVEFVREKRTNDYDGYTDGTDLWNLEFRTAVKFSLEKLLSPGWGVGAYAGYLHADVRKGFDFLSGRRSRLDWYVKFSVTRFCKDGWRIQGAVAYFDRKKKGGGWLDNRGMHVLIPGLSVLKYFADRKGRFFVRIQAPLHEDFRFLPQEPYDLANAPWPKFLGEVGLIWEW